MAWTSHNWGTYYLGVEEEILDNMPDAFGHKVQVNAFVDASHATDLL